MQLRILELSVMFRAFGNSNHMLDWLAVANGEAGGLSFEMRLMHVT